MSGLGSDLTSPASSRRAEKQLANLLQSNDPEGLPGRGVRDTVTGSASGQLAQTTPRPLQIHIRGAGKEAGRGKKACL